MVEPDRTGQAAAGSLERDLQIDSLCSRFEAALKAGENPPLADYLALAPETLRESLEVELRHVLQAFADSGDTVALAPKSGGGPHPNSQFGDYQLLTEIARGGMGVVYKARQTKLNRVVALKMILSGELAGEAAVRRFHAEAEAAAQLRHPGIVAVYEVGQERGQHFFSMEFVEGQSLSALARDKPFSAQAAARCLKSIAEAIHYAHERGVLHRDLKPANVLIDSDGRPRVTDFGLAKRMENTSGQTRTQDMVGTPSYMPPEQAGRRTSEIGPASDVYSLGAILYELLTGRPPFRGETLLDTVTQVLEREPVSPRLLNPLTPRDLETICLKCLRKEPARRYATAAELAADLGNWLESKPIAARPVGRAEKVWLWCKRRPTLVGMSVLLLVLAVGGTLAGGLIVRERQNATHAAGLVEMLASADTPQVPEIVKEVHEYSAWAHPMLAKKLAQAKEGSTEKLHLTLALAEKDERQLEYLFDQLLRADAARFPVIRDSLAEHKEQLAGRLWAVLTSRDADPQQQRLRAAGALAKYDPQDPRWNSAAQEAARQLVAVNPLFVGQWQEILRPLRDRLVPPLANLFADPEQSEVARTLATSLLADYAQDDPDILTRLVVTADAQAFALLFPALEKHESVAIEKLQAVLARKTEPSWQDPPLDSAWVEPPRSARLQIEAAHGMLAERFAFCQDLPWSDFPPLAEALRSSGYRPTRVRPWSSSPLPGIPARREGAESEGGEAAGSARTVPAIMVAAIWTRDGKRWELQADLPLDQLPRSGRVAEKGGLLPADIAALPAADAAAERRFVLLWSQPAAPEEQKPLFLDFGEQTFETLRSRLLAGGYNSQVTLNVWIDADSQRKYAGIWSNQGAASESIPAYAGFPLIDQPQWDVAVAPVDVPSGAAESAGTATPGPATRYAAVWRADVDYESKLLSSLPLESALAQLQPLIAQGYRPFAIAIDSPLPGTPEREAGGEGESGEGGGDRETRHTRDMSQQTTLALVLHRPLVPDASKEQLAREQAAAAVGLLRMDAADRVWPLFQHQADPRLRSYLLSRLAAYGVGLPALLAQLTVETDISRRRALILGLGEFAHAKRLSDAQRMAAIADLAKRYGDDPDPGVHGAAEWALQNLGAQEEIAKVRAAHSTGRPLGERRWYLTKTGTAPTSAGSPATGSGLSFVIFDPAEFEMGSPVSEAERFQGPTGKNESRHRRRIDRRFALGMHEVTVAQFQAFRGDHAFDRTKAREADAPANMLTWYEAAAYCNWLSEQEGIPPAQWCYDPNQAFAEGMTLVPDYLRRTGYRLPTEAEWEYAARAGATTARYFGETESLLGEYAWYTKTSGDKWLLPVGSLKPNDNGLFDVLGNALEWCQERPLHFTKDQEWLGDREQVERVTNQEGRALRGGAFNFEAPFVRSSNRTTLPPHNRFSLFGFRVARTYPEAR